MTTEIKSDEKVINYRNDFQLKGFLRYLLPRDRPLLFQKVEGKSF